MAPRSVVAAMTMALLFTGCGVSLPSEYRVEDLRVLNIRAEPPEIALLDPGEMLDPRTVTIEDLTIDRLRRTRVEFTALVAHPDIDARPIMTWFRCKEGSSGGFDRPPCSEDLRVEFATTAGDESFEVVPADLVVEDAVSSGLAEALSPFLTDPRDLFSGFYAFFNVLAAVEDPEVPADTPAIEATKRLVVFDPLLMGLVLRLAREQASELPMFQGIDLPDLCRSKSDAELDSIFASLMARRPNENPVFVRLEYRRGPEPESREEASMEPGTPVTDEVIVVSPGERVRFGGIVSEAEVYEVVDDNCEIQRFTETLSFSWFTNMGNLSSQITSISPKDPSSEKETTWTAPDASAFEGAELNVRIYSVLRDGRGGSDEAIARLLVRK